jgi:hypothetical protein
MANSLIRFPIAARLIQAGGTTADIMPQHRRAAHLIAELALRFSSIADYRPIGYHQRQLSDRPEPDPRSATSPA